MANIARLYSIRPEDANGILVVVAGDAKTGKSSLISTLYPGNFRDRIAPELMDRVLTAERYPDLVRIKIRDTTWSSENLDEDFRAANSVILTFACDQHETLANIKSIWLPRLERLRANLPVIIVGCMRDRIEKRQVNRVTNEMSSIWKHFPQVEHFMLCSALENTGLDEVFYHAQIAALYPLTPLVDKSTDGLKAQCVSALTQIFRDHDKDGDGVLNQVELSGFQVQIFGYPLSVEEYENVTTHLKESKDAMVVINGVDLEGFLTMMKESFTARPETIWTMLRKSGYDNDLQLSRDS